MSPTENVTGKRVVAALVDIVTLSVVFVVFVLLFGDTESSTTTSSGTTTDHGFRFNLNGWPFVVYLIVALAYFIVTEAVWPATPGKLALGLRVTSVGGAPMTIGKAVVRNLCESSMACLSCISSESSRSPRANWTSAWATWSLAPSSLAPERVGLRQNRAARIRRQRSPQIRKQRPTTDD